MPDKTTAEADKPTPAETKKATAEAKHHKFREDMYPVVEAARQKVVEAEAAVAKAKEDLDAEIRTTNGLPFRPAN